MSLLRFVTASLLLTSLVTAAGCSTEADAKDDVDVETTESELNSFGATNLGTLKNGETRVVQYQPNYQSFSFEAKGGDDITVDIQSSDGDPIGWLTDANYKVLASNDDASNKTLDARVKFKLPASQFTRQYRIVFRDYWWRPSTFRVTLTIIRAPTTCTYSGKQYSIGQEFDAGDYCNTCTCTSNGSVSCTTKSCPCDPAMETHRTYVGTPQQCMVIRFTCPWHQRAFTNSCGCGCETIP